jgi:hypothetical protein
VHVAKHNLTLKSIEGSCVLVGIYLCTQLSAFEKVVSIDKEGKLKVPELNGKFAQWWLEDGQPFRNLEVVEEFSHSLAKV